MHGIHTTVASHENGATIAIKLGLNIKNAVGRYKPVDDFYYNKKRISDSVANSMDSRRCYYK